MSFIIEKEGYILLQLHIQPNASKSEIAGMHGERLKIRLKAPPVEGKANEELIRFFSDIIGVPKGQIEIAKGLSNRQKTLKLSGIKTTDIKKLLQTNKIL